MSTIHATTGTNAYQQVSRYAGIEGATAHQLVSMLMQCAIDNLAMAKGFIERKNYDKKAQSLRKVIAIVTELQSSLDKENGGDIANNLSNLYDYIFKLIIVASMENRPETITEASELMLNLLDSWNMIPEQQRHR